jgi:hypothetical protein
MHPYTPREMSKPTIIKASIAAILLAAAAILLLRPAPKTEEEIAGYGDPAASYWLCTASTCSKGFELSMAELGAFLDANPDATPSCPHCKGTTSVRAAKCGSCREIIPKAARAAAPSRGGAKDAGPALCPTCGEPSGGR